MSNQSSNLRNSGSFSFSTPFLTPLKPYATTRRTFFPFQHNFTLIGGRSRRRSSSVPLKVAAQSSSSDVVLIATKEHHDGSLIFRFGDASEVVEDDEVVEDIESQTEEESNVVKVLDGDQDRQVIIETGDSGYDSVMGRLDEAADGVRSADIGSDIAESETHGIRDLSDYRAESNDTLLDISEEEVLASQSDANLNDFNDFIESTIDETKFSEELDEEDSSDPTINLLNNNPNIEKSAEPEGTLLKGSDDEPVDPSVSVELESTQDSQVEVMDDLDNVEAEDTSKSDTGNVSIELESTQVLQTEVMDDLDKVETEDTRKSDTEEITSSAFPATMHISDIELTDAANESSEEELKDIIIDEGTLIDELLPSKSLEVQLMGAVNEDVEEELQDMNINEATIIHEIPSSDQSVVEPTLDEVNQLQSVHLNDQTMEDELQEVSTKNREENDVAFVVPVSTVEEAGINVEEEVSQPQSTPLELKPITQVLDIDLQDNMGQDLDNGILHDSDIKVTSVSDKLEATQVSDNEVMDVTQPNGEDESQVVDNEDTSEADTKDLLRPATMHVSYIDMNEKLQNMNISEDTFIDEMPTPDPLGSEPTLKVSTNKGMIVDMDERLQDMKISEGAFIDEIPASVPLGGEPTLEVSSTEDMGVKDLAVEDELQLVSNNVDIDERLQDMNISEGTFIDEIPASDPLEAEPTLEVSSTEGMDVKDPAAEDDLQIVSNNVDINERLQDMNISEGTFIDEIPASDPVGAEPTLEVSSTVGMDVKDLVVENELQLVSNNIDMDERLQDMNISEGTFIDEIPASDPLGAEPTIEVSSTEGMDVKDLAVEDELQLVSNDLDMDERLQDKNISEDTFVDEIPASDPLVAEPTLEVSSTEGMEVKDLAVEDEMQLVSNNKMDANEIADVIPADPILEEEVSQLQLTPVELKATMQVSDIKVQDATGQNLDDEILQVINEDAGASYIEDAEQPSHQLESKPVQDEGVKHMLEQSAERLQDMDISEGTFIDEIPTSDRLGAESTLEVSTTKDMNFKDLGVDELQLVSNDKMDENEITDVMPAEPLLEEEVSQSHVTPVELKATMQVSDIKVQDATGQNPDDEILQVNNEDAGDSYIEDVEPSPHQLESHLVQVEGVKDMLEQCDESDAVESSILPKQGSQDPLLEADRTESMVGSSELAEASEITAVLLAAEAEVERKEIYLTDVFLLSGAALLEHPIKALTGGDDAYFVAGSKWLGVANGVSQWSLEGTGPGLFAQELMRACGEIVLDTNSIPMTKPAELLCRGVKETNMSGSSSVLIANFNGQALHVANIGDTGFLIVRHGAVYKKSSPLLHEFHFAVQLDDSGDPLQLVDEHLIELEVGDIVISATDGLFDNLYEREITMIVSKSLQAGMKPQEIANILATRAQEVGKSSLVRSPFSDAAQTAGYTGYAGGKPDNVAVIVSLVEKGSNLLAV